MKRRGFSFLEVLLALAILALISASLAPLMTGLTVTDRKVRLRSDSWRAAQAALTALYLGEPAAWKELENESPYRLALEPQPATGGARWHKLTVSPPDSPQTALHVYLESAAF